MRIHAYALTVRGADVAVGDMAGERARCLVGSAAGTLVVGWGGGCCAVLC